MEKRIKETMTKKKVLIAYGGMVVGGSTTALLSMLKEWNFEKYDVDIKNWTVPIQKIYNGVSEFVAARMINGG